MIKIKSIITAIVMLMFLWLTFTTHAFAEFVDISLTPPLIELTIKPGKSVLIAYNVENYGDPVVAKAYVMPFTPLGNYGNIAISPEFDGPIRFTLANSLIDIEQHFVLKTKGKEQILLQIRAPDGAPVGDYYYTLLIETQPPPSVDGTTAGTAKATIGSNIIITVTDTGDIDINGRVSLFDVLGGKKIRFFGKTFTFFDSNDKIPVVLTVYNQGKNYIKPTGSIKLKGNFGETANYDLLPQNILKDSQRLLQATPSAAIECKDHDSHIYCNQKVTLLLDGFFIGRYLLSTNFNFGEGSPMLTANSSFIALPFRLGLALIGVMGFTILIIRVLRRNNDHE